MKVYIYKGFTNEDAIVRIFLEIKLLPELATKFVSIIDDEF